MSAAPQRSSRTRLPLDNEHLAARLDQIADLLEAQDANTFRVRAYRNAADTVSNLERPVHQLLDTGGPTALRALPGIGESLACSIEQLVHTDHIGLLDRLQGGSSSLDIFATVAGIGPALALRLHEELGIESLEELEIAANDGRLERVQGFGGGRVRAVRESLAGRFRRRPRALESARRAQIGRDPPVAELLDVDEEYRTRAEAGTLPRIAPRRFNPTGEAWLPVLHTQRGDRHYTALFSDTARAHELGTTRDWVVIYRDDDRDHRQWTAVTARQGPLAGHRIVRGRETQYREHWRKAAAEKQRT